MGNFDKLFIVVTKLHPVIFFPPLQIRDAKILHETGGIEMTSNENFCGNVLNTVSKTSVFQNLMTFS